jgi:hypothetical protein
MFRVDVFAGEVRGVAPRLIDKTQATKAVNCLLSNGDLRSIEEALPLDVQPTLAGGVSSLYLYGTHFFSWAGRVNAVGSPVRQDAYDRVYFTGDGVPKYTRNDIALGAGALPFADYELGIPAPDAAPIITYEAPETNEDPLDDDTRYYVCTFASTVGEESAPSPVSAKVVVQAPDTDTLTVSLPTLLTNSSDVAFVTLYRSATGGSTAEFYKVKTVAIGTESVVDDVPESSLGNLLATEYFEKPPTDMHSLIMITGGMLVGASGQTVCPSEAYLP